MNERKRERERERERERRGREKIGCEIREIADRLRRIDRRFSRVNAARQRDALWKIDSIKPSIIHIYIYIYLFIYIYIHINVRISIARTPLRPPLPPPPPPLVSIAFTLYKREYRN